MICKKCGNKVNASHGKCPACGAGMPETMGGNGFFDILSPEVLDNAPVVMPQQGASGVSESAMRNEIAKRDAFWSSKLKAAKRLTAVFLVLFLFFAAVTAVVTVMYINKEPEKFLNELPDTVITQGSDEDVSNEAAEEDNVGKFKADSDGTEYLMGDSNMTEIGDDIPDKYQKKLVFTVENGTFNYGKTDWIFYVTLVDENYEHSETGTATLRGYAASLPDIIPDEDYIYDVAQINFDAPITMESDGVYVLKCTPATDPCTYCGTHDHTSAEHPACDICGSKNHDTVKCTACKTCGSTAHTTENHKCGNCGAKNHKTENCPACTVCRSTAHTTENHKCDNCGAKDHKTENCDKPDACSVCGLTTHTTENHKCDNCGAKDHKNENCDKPDACSVCGLTTHTTENHKCDNCGAKDHKTENCDKPDACSVCGLTTHTTENHKCDNCGAKDHKTENCDKPDACSVCGLTTHTTANHKCDICGAKDHKTENCDKPEACSVCGLTTHTTENHKCDECGAKDHKTEDCTNNENGIIYEPIE